MTSLPTALFDFAPHLKQREQSIDAIREFISHQAFRSAVVDELVLDEDFWRRPLRPEDLVLLPYREPIADDSANCLAAVASHRMLLSIYELGVARLPRQRPSPQEVDRFAEFYSDRNQLAAARVRPFLENYVFHGLGLAADATVGKSDARKGLKQLAEDESAFWQRAFAELARDGYLDDGAKFSLIQRACLLPTKRTALARAQAAGFFDPLPTGDRPELSAGAQPTIAALRERFGVHRAAHSYWQFYLPTSLAQTNLLCALAQRPDRALALYGAAFAAEVEWHVFAAALEDAFPQIAKAGPSPAVSDRDSTWTRFERAVARVETLYGAAGAHQMDLGVSAARQLGARARRDLGEQLAWLSASQSYCALAHVVSERIQRECPDIDRETFVEPREMCSTTHVHDDHRLVVIESGDMVFWGNLGMRLEMTVGDMVLIPKGRLHGSTVVSEECTYHQPIIFEEWVRQLVGEHEATKKPVHTAQAPTLSV